MRIYHIIESVKSPGSFYSEDYGTFKGFIFANRYPDRRQAVRVIEENEIEFCKITEVYEK